jgi:hypothetical protein
MIFDKLKGVNMSIQDILKQSTYHDNDDLSSLDIDYSNPEQLLLLDELRDIMEKLNSVNNSINYLKQPVIYTGNLRKNSAGRYELPNGHYYTCGSGIECLITDTRHEIFNKENNEYEPTPYWAWTSVEGNGEDYYLVHHEDVPMQGLKVRKRESN